MAFKIGKNYKICLIVFGHTLTYSCTVLGEDSNFITFKDKFEKEYNYNKNCIISFEEKKDGY